mmetsp:Transcript_32380/g.44363  ORF Transcript_32380/g.44363 Transcript_32380/m.44363 type:complete len:509 (+) Transcript_32380:174-1700(+)
MSVSAESALITTNNRPPTPFPYFVTQSFWEESLWFYRLAFKLLAETESNRKGENNDGSIENYWLKSLPKSFSTPLHWNDEDLEQLQYPSLVQKVQQQKKDWKAFYDKWQSCIFSSSDINQLSPKAVSYNRFVWALECVNSRAFSGVYEGSEASDRKKLLLFATSLGILWPALHLGTFDQSFSALIVVAVSIIARDVIFSKVAQLKRYVLCPSVDMFNHKSTAQSDVSYNYFSDTFEVRIDNSYQPGEQVFISYGKQSNDRLLQFYGFVDADNVFDSYDFNCGVLELILKYADDITNIDPIPTTPNLTPQQRLQVIAEALENTPLVDEDKTSASPSKRTVSAHTVRVFRSAPASSIKKIETSKSNGGKEENNAVLQNVADILSKKKESAALTSRFDDLTVRALRALFSSNTEWNALFSASPVVSLEQLGRPLSADSEAVLNRALQTIVASELASKATSLKDDEALLTRYLATPVQTKSVSASGKFDDKEVTALAFRIEKKKILQQALSL